MVPKRFSAAFQRAIAIILAAGCFSVAQAGQDEDLDLIPESVSSALLPTPKAGKGPLSLQLFTEDEYQYNSNRSVVVPLPASYLPDWKNRFTFYTKADVRAHKTLTFSVTDRLNQLSDSYSDFPSGVVQNDLNELYVSWQAGGENYLDAGRINLKSGVAIGFNPVDFFKKDAVSLRISEDPLVLRDNRLGTVMLRAQSIQSFGSITVAAAPQISAPPGTLLSDGSSFALGLQHTNPYPRYLAKFNGSYKDVNAELLYYNENADSFLGAAVSRGIGDQTVLYAEWSGGPQYNIIGGALVYDGQQLGVDTEKYVSFLPRDYDKRFRSQAVLGMSFTEKRYKRSTYLEYHYNGAGMDQTDWNYWYTGGYYASQLAPFYDQPMLALWSIRSYAQRMMEPASRHQLFWRTQWQDAIIPRLDLVGLAQINPVDGSFFFQPMAKYYAGDNFSLTLTMYFYVGKPRSEYGSVNTANVSKFAVTYYI
ncbi:MAG: hypothetical protein WCS77_02615 [Elusimicrobiaceae bacterium]